MAKRSILLAVLIALALALTCPAAYADVVKVGVLTFNSISAKDYDADLAEGAAQAGLELLFSVQRHVYFDTLSSMLLALQAGQIDKIMIPTAVAEYIVAGNDALFVEPASLIRVQEALSMAVLEDNSELLTLLNDAIAALQADGTIDALIKDYIDGATPNAEVTLVDLPVIEGAETVKVAITGDMPPIDYTTADGKPAGFNISLLSAISKQAGVNIELISIDSGARVISLTSGRADAVFWMRSVVLPDGTVNTSDDTPQEVALTNPYYTDTVCEVIMK